MRRSTLIPAILTLLTISGNFNGRTRPDAGRVCPDSRLRGSPSKQGWRLRRSGRSAFEPGRDQLGLAGAQARGGLGAGYPGLHQVRQVVSRRCQRRVRPDAGRQARRGHHGPRLDGGVGAQDRRFGHGQGGCRLPRQERQELRGSSDGDRRTRSRSWHVAGFLQVERDAPGHA